MDLEEKRKQMREIEEVLPKLLTMPSATRNRSLLEGGWRRYLITLTDAGTEEVVRQVETYQKPEDIGQLSAALTKIAVPPDDYLEEIEFSFNTVKDGELWSATVRQLWQKEILGGAPSEMRESTKQDHRDLVKRYRRSNLSQREFCRENYVSRSKLTTALQFVNQEDRPPQP